MIGSIGAESRYSTGYNNLKPHRNQNKWADTLAQTVWIRRILAVERISIVLRKVQ